MAKSANATPRLRTLNQVAADLGLTFFRAAYFVRTRGIQPSFVASRIRLFDDEAVKLISEAANAANEKRRG